MIYGTPCVHLFYSIDLLSTGMIGYGMAKAAVHQLVKSLSSEGSGLPKEAFVTAILPYVIFSPLDVSTIKYKLPYFIQTWFGTQFQRNWIVALNVLPIFLVMFWKLLELTLHFDHLVFIVCTTL